MEEKDSTLSHKTCGLCSACTISNDCTKCENCIRNYIDVNINQAQNSRLRRCLKRICRASSSDIRMPAGVEFDPFGQTDYKNISNLQDVNNSLSILELTEFKTGESKNRGKWLHGITGDTETKTAGEKTNVDLAALDESSDESDKVNNNEPSLEKCGDCSSCAAPDCGSCSSKNPSTGKTCRLQSKIKAADSIDEERQIEVERQKSRGRRMRCGVCPGCKTTKNCGVCTTCIRKRKNKLFTQTCNDRKCHVLMSEKSQRCGQCESCRRLPCEDCGHCKAGQAKLCRAKRCKNPTWVKIKKRIPKNKKSKSVEFIQEGSSGNEMDNEEESFGDSQTNNNLSRKEEEQNGNKVTVDTEEHKDKLRRRIRCGTCSGCKTTQNCGGCTVCVRKKKNKIYSVYSIGSSVCNLRKCHVLISEKSQRCGQCENCQRLHCEDCGHCKAGQANFCKAKRCKNPTWVKITKKRIPKNEMTSEEEKQNEEKQNGNKVSHDVQAHKDELKQPKHIKRTKRCKKCDGCRAEDCGNCQSCKMNQQFGEKIVLGKLPCLTNICKFPVELALGKDKDKLSLLNEQDDAPEGAVCPVKVVQGRLYDGRCYFCKKLPRMGKSSRSELLRHYAISHFSKELKDEFAGVTFCQQCNLQIKVDAVNHFAVNHFGQKHEEVVKYLPREAAILFPEKKHQRSIVRRKVKKVKWPEVPEGFYPAADTRDWKGDSHDDLIREEKVECEIVNGWTIEHHIDELEEPPPSLNEPDFTGVGGICNVCQTEYPEVTATAMHLHEDHHIQGGSSYIMRDCEKLIKSGFIKLVSEENGKSGNAISEIAVKRTNKEIESSENCTPSRNSDGDMDIKLKRSVARKSTSRKSRSSSTAMKEQITRSNSQYSSSNDEETSAHCDETDSEHLPATIRDKDDENSTPSRNSNVYLDFQSKKNVAWKSTSRKSRSPHSSSARMSSTTSFKFDSKRHSADSKSVFEDETRGQLSDSDSRSSYADDFSPFWEAIGVKYQEEEK